jgi:hypothetical protein
MDIHGKDRYIVHKRAMFDSKLLNYRRPSESIKQKVVKMGNYYTNNGVYMTHIYIYGGFLK